MSHHIPLRKAVFPVAGLGTRFLPATKAQPKEMLPIVDKPTIQYIVEEAVASGIEDIIEVNGDKDIQKDVILNINSGEMMLNIDGKNIKYEYVALTADEIIENSEENNNSDENWF